ncbi:unnamed protein product [Paramecium octaurelia]|uniref:Uncharacterized protein n=1 Tax=Paramecium octaurelia TaxID=43137 RepID=A0A8S1S9N7_PAROT|nr:unnamed protein product [Paramecium octaurelia]
MYNQRLRFLASAVLQEQAQQIQNSERKLNQQENYIIYNIIQLSENANIKVEIEKLVIEFQSLLIQKYLKEAISHLLIQLDHIFLSYQFESQPDDIKCYISTIKYLSSFVSNIPSFSLFLEELNNCLQYQTFDYMKTVAKRALKLMKFQQLLCYYMDQFQKQRGIDLNKYYNLQGFLKIYKGYGKIKFAFKKQKKQLKSHNTHSQSSISTTYSVPYPVTPQPQIVGYHNQFQQPYSTITMYQLESCASLTSPTSLIQPQPQIDSYSHLESYSLQGGQNFQGQPEYGISVIQQPSIPQQWSTYEYIPMPQSYNSGMNQAYSPNEHYQKNYQFQNMPQQQQQQQQQQKQQQQYQQKQQQQQVQQIQYNQYTQNQQQPIQQGQNVPLPQFHHTEQDNFKLQQMLNNMQFCQEDATKQVAMTDSVFQQSLSEISEVQDKSVQQFGFTSFRPDTKQLDDASFQEQINQRIEEKQEQAKQNVREQQIIQKDVGQGKQIKQVINQEGSILQRDDGLKFKILEQSEFEELVINKAKITQNLLDPETNQQVFSTQLSQFILGNSNQHDLEAISLLERFLEKKQSQFERDDQKKQILQLLDF